MPSGPTGAETRRSRGGFLLKVLLAGGGTAGHINPALAIAKYIRARGAGNEVLFVGTREGLEHQLVPREGFSIEYVDVRGFKRKLSLYNIGTARRAVTSIGEARAVIKRFSPDVVVGTGGYVSWPVLYSAARMGIPTAIHEQNSFPGVTSRLLSRRVDRVMISFEDSRRYFKDGDKLILTGNPVREEMIYAKKDEARRSLGLDSRPFVVSFAGSLGAREINKCVIDLLGLIKDEHGVQYLHATGERGYLWVPEKIAEAGIDLSRYPELRVEKYIYDMPLVMAAADLVICRCGAITLSELAVQGKASILIPSPNVANDHQEHNARAFEKAGAAVVVREAQMSAPLLRSLIKELTEDDARRQTMERNAHSLAIFDSCDKIYSIIASLVR